MAEGVGTRWTLTLDAYGEVTGPVAHGSDAPPSPASSDGCLAFAGTGATREEALQDARRQWLDQLPWVLGLLEKLGRAERAGGDLDDGELVAQLRHLVGGDPVPEGRTSIPSFALPGWVALVRRVVAVHARDVLEDAERVEEEGGPQEDGGGVAVSMANVARTSGEALRSLAERSRDAVMIVERSGRVSYLNGACERLLGRRAGALAGTSHLDLFPPQQHDALRETFARSLAAPGRPAAVDIDTLDQRGRPRQLSLGYTHHVVSPVRSVVVVHVAEASEEARAARQERELEAQLWQAQKMVAVGQMTAGIAHDFNNVLAVIMSNVELLELSLDEGAEDVREEIDALREA